MTWLKDHLGVALLLVVVPIGVLVSRGNILMSVGVGMLAALLAVAAVRFLNRGSGSTTGGALPSTFVWEVPLPASNNEERLVAQLAAIGLKVDDRDSSENALFSGSQMRTRLLGGYFIAPRNLPIKVSWDRHDGQDPGVAKIEDGLGPIAVRDRALKTRYEARVSEIRVSIGSSGE